MDKCLVKLHSIPCAPYVLQEVVLCVYCPCVGWHYDYHRSYGGQRVSSRPHVLGSLGVLFCESHPCLSPRVCLVLTVWPPRSLSTRCSSHCWLHWRLSSSLWSGCERACRFAPSDDVHSHSYSLFVCFPQESSGVRGWLFIRHFAFVLAFVFNWAYPAVHQYVDPDNDNITLAILDGIVVSTQTTVLVLVRFGLRMPGCTRCLLGCMDSKTTVIPTTPSFAAAAISEADDSLSSDSSSQSSQSRWFQLGSRAVKSMPSRVSPPFPLLRRLPLFPPLCLCVCLRSASIRRTDAADPSS